MRTCILGFDCLEPSLVRKWINDLPAFRALCDGGLWGNLASCIPPITVPAWSCMTSGCDPGALGIYGFRNRADYGYGKLAVADSSWVREPRLWDTLGAQGKKCVVLGVPGTYPARPVNGAMVSCFMTPADGADWAWPASAKERVRSWLGGAEYPFDVKDYRGADKRRIRDEIFEGAQRRFDVALRFWEEEKPDFFMMVDIGCDRIQHSMWPHFDQEHPGYRFDPALSAAIPEYYRFLDAQIARFLEKIDLRETRLLVVSDHGALRCDGGFCINEWLRREGLLVLKKGAKEAGADSIVWKKTTAWAEGGYYARIFLNIAGREPQGIVDPLRYEHARSEIGHRLAGVTHPDGRPLKIEALRPQQIYGRVEGIAPDLIVFFDDHRRRAVAGLSDDSLFVSGDGWGLDGANHAPNGFYCLREPGRTPGQQDLSITDIHSLVLGEKIADRAAAKSEAPDVPPVPPAAPSGKPAFSEAGRESVERRLRDLGYLG